MVLRIDVAVYSALGLLDGTHTPMLDLQIMLRTISIEKVSILS